MAPVNDRWDEMERRPAGFGMETARLRSDDEVRAERDPVAEEDADLLERAPAPRGGDGWRLSPGGGRCRAPLTDG